MVSTFSLVIFFSILLIAEYFLLRSDIFSPGFLFAASFFMCSVCTWIISKSWNIETISKKTFFIILFGAIIFESVELLVRLSPKVVWKFNTKKRIHMLGTSNEILPLYVSDSVLKIGIILSVVLIVWTFSYVAKYAVKGNWNAMMAAYKDVFNLDPKAFGVSRKILNQFNKVLTALEYLLLYIYCFNKRLNAVSKRRIMLFILNFVLYLVFLFFLSGGRQTVIKFIVAWLTINYLCASFNTGKSEKKREKRKFSFITLCIVSILMPSFYFLGRLAGRKEGMVMDASVGYLSTGIYGLEWMVSKNYTSHYFAQHSFSIIFDFLKFLGFIPQKETFISFFPMTWHGNTVTIFGRWYWDFGVTGCFVLTAIVAFIFANMFYNKINRSQNSAKRDIFVILYGFMVYALFFAGYDDFFFNFPTVNTFLTIILILLFYYYVCIRKVCFRGLEKR